MVKKLNISQSMYEDVMYLVLHRERVSIYMYLTTMQTSYTKRLSKVGVISNMILRSVQALE